MTTHSFTNWLKIEVHSARSALLRLYEEEERLKHIEGPRLEREYMEAVGHYEETVVKEEMECELLTTKQRLVQAAINRREEIDEVAIDQKIEELRKDMMDAAVGDPPPQPYADLSGEQSDELQNLYGQIVKQFHPQMHPEMTQAERELYQKAQEAYRRRDLPALKLIWEMLMSGYAQMELEMVEGPTELQANTEPVREESTRDYTTDYSLASELYPGFIPLQEEAAILEEWKKYKEKAEEMLEALQQMKEKFPYSAQEMLENKEMLEEYKQNLENRMHIAKKQREQLTQNIKHMIGDAKKRG